MRKNAVAFWAVITLLLAIGPVAAIVYGEPDNGRHPNVGATFRVWYDPAFPNGVQGFAHCSGILISPTVFLGAGHCAITSRDAQVLRGRQTWVTFGPDVDVALQACSADGPDTVTCPGSIRVEESVPNPALTLVWEGLAASGRNDLPKDMDLGVFILSEAVTDQTPAVLPVEGYLDAMRQQNGLHDALFFVVGYGIDATFMEGPPTYQWAPYRRVAVSEFLAMTPGSLILSQNPALDNGGVCVHDSGGPALLGDTPVGIVSSGDAAPCRAIGIYIRLDTAPARAFLGQYVTLP